MSGHDASDVGLSAVKEGLERFAAGFTHLPLYHRICRAAAQDDEVASVLTHARPGQARAVLLLAAIHDLVLSHPDLPAARWFSSVVGASNVPTTGDPWPDIRAAVIDHRASLERTVAERSTQTNEVNRVAFLAPVIADVCAGAPQRDLILVELGASAGLLLAPDRYDVQLQLPGGGVRRYGDATSPVRCGGRLTDDSGPLSEAALPPIVARRGVDADPQSLRDPDAVRWLEACLWPDQPARVERFAAAAELVRGDPPVVVRGDLIEALPDLLNDASHDLDPARVQLVVFSSWALTYVARPRRTEVPAILAAFAGRTGIPVWWVTAEPPAGVPGIPLPPGWSADDTGTVLGVRAWRGGDEAPPRLWGTCHPHGEWLTRLA
jgi:hypothetical protein